LHDPRHFLSVSSPPPPESTSSLLRRRPVGLGLGMGLAGPGFGGPSPQPVTALAGGGPPLAESLLSSLGSRKSLFLSAAFTSAWCFSSRFCSGFKSSACRLGFGRSQCGLRSAGAGAGASIGSGGACLAGGGFRSDSEDEGDEGALTGALGFLEPMTCTKHNENIEARRQLAGSVL
jgi:hypothetical protein